MAVIGFPDLAAALKLTGDAEVLPGVGEHTVTPMVAAVQPDGEGVGVGGGVEAPNMSAMSGAPAAAPG